jgi:hypothetical protein
VNMDWRILSLRASDCVTTLCSTSEQKEGLLAGQLRVGSRSCILENDLGLKIRVTADTHAHRPCGVSRLTHRLLQHARSIILALL